MYIQRSLLFLLSISFFVISFANNSDASTNRCPRHVVQTEVKAKQAKTKFLSGSLSSINDYLNTHHVLAFVQNPISVKSYYDFGIKDIGNGRYCVLLNKVRVDYRSSPRIVMPSNLKKSSCEYKIIRKHEQRHLDTHYEYYNKSVGQYEAFLGRIARNVPVFNPVTNEAEAEQVKQAIKDYFDKKFYERVTISIGEMRKLQERIDSPQEYIFTGRKIDRCNELEKRSKSKNKKTFYDH